MNDRNEGGDREAHFAAYLANLAAREERAALAALRRGLGKEPGEAPEVLRYVVPWLPAQVGARQENAFYQVAALFAWHQGSWGVDGAVGGARNLGASLRWLAGATPSRAAGVERRFVALLNSHIDDLGSHLRQAVGLLKSDDIPIDWAQLLRDLQRWDRPGRAVQRAWARAFWGQASAHADQETSPTPAANAAGVASTDE